MQERNLQEGNIANSAPKWASLQSGSHSQSRVLKCVHTWTVDHFSYHLEPELQDHLYLDSSRFSPFKFKQDKLRFFLRLYPRGLGDESNKNYISLYLHLDSTESQNVNLKIKLALLDDQKSCFRVRGNLTISLICSLFSSECV